MIIFPKEIYPGSKQDTKLTSLKKYIVPNRPGTKHLNEAKKGVVLLFTPTPSISAVAGAATEVVGTLVLEMKKQQGELQEKEEVV